MTIVKEIQAKTLLAREDEVLIYMTFPAEHWARIYSTNPLERLNREVKRRTDVVSIFPDGAAVIRLVGSVLIEINDEWQAGRRYFSQASMRKLHEPEELARRCPAHYGWHRFTDDKEQRNVRSPEGKVCFVDRTGATRQSHGFH
jgi:hypothetical protein